jgi:chemosensory pili system protein ChpB (putative protein-glutamate methylesterase)
VYGVDSALRSNIHQHIPNMDYGRGDTAYSMNDQELRQISIAIASDSLRQRSNLRKVLEQSGLHVVLSEPLTRLFLHKLKKTSAEVLLLDLHDDQTHDDELLHEVLDTVTIPIIFNDVTALLVNEPAHNPKWHLSLMRKIAESTGNDMFMAAEPASAVHKEEMLPEKTSRSSHRLARNVWVLGASLGGPEAVKRFLRSLPADIPAAFIVAQHLGANFVGLLAEQLNRVCKLNVMAPKAGHLFQHQDVIVAPVEEHLRINPIGNIELDQLAEVPEYSPSIDLVLRDVADRYGSSAGAIIFSGMGDDGRLGCEYMQAKAGQVWLQTSESCVVSSMPDNVRRTCQPEFVGNPEQLARHLAMHLEQVEEYS